MPADHLSSTEKPHHFTKFGIPYRNLWYMLLYAWNEPPEFKGNIVDDIEKTPTLDTLLCLVLAKLVQQRFRIGLGRNFIEQTNIIRGIRGKINFNESLKRNLFEKGRASCTFQEFSINVPKNQIIRTTMMRMIRSGLFGPDLVFGREVRQKLRMLVRSMDGIDFVELTPDLLRRQQLGRNDRDYRIMLAICELLLHRYMPADFEGQIHLPEIDHETLKMFRVFERFVANFYQYHLHGWRVQPQKVLHWNEIPTNVYMPIMQPDVVMKENGTNRTILIDTKFTPQTARGRWGNLSFHSGHLYQIYAYLQTQGQISDQYKYAEGILLYPASSSSRLSERYRLEDLTIRVENLDLTVEWWQVEKQLLTLITG